MSSSLKSIVPLGYTAPEFPSLYWPFPIARYDRSDHHLFFINDVWRFTLIWTLLFFLFVHLAASVFAVVVNGRHSKMAWVIPVVYVFIGGVEGFVAGSLVGLLVGGLYRVGLMPVSTWIPFVLGLINTMVLILSSFSMRGGL